MTTTGTKVLISAIWFTHALGVSRVGVKIKSLHRHSETYVSPSWSTFGGRWIKKAHLRYSPLVEWNHFKTIIYPIVKCSGSNGMADVLKKYWNWQD